MLNWHRQLLRISHSREQLVNFQGNREGGKWGSVVIYSLACLYFLFTALIWITKCKLFIVFYWKTLLAHWYVEFLIPSKAQLCSWEAASPLILTSKGECPLETRASTFPITLSQHKATSILTQTSCLTDTSVRAPQTLVFCCSYDPRAGVTWG